jgi:hypothetical protein
MAVTEKQLANLRPKVFTSEEAQRNGRKGAAASVKARRKQKRMRETLKMLLSLPSDVREGLSRMESSCIAQVLKAEGGDLAAFLAVRDTIGEKPTDKTDITSSDNSLAGGSQSAERRAMAFMQRLDALREARKAQEVQ